MGKVLDGYTKIRNSTFWNATKQLGRGYAVQNKAEEQELYNYISKLDQGQFDAAPPGLVTKLGQGWVDVLSALASQITGSPTPPQPPTGGVGHQGNGFVQNLQGNEYAASSDAERAHYGGIIVGFGNYIDVGNFQKAHPSCHGYGYQTSVEVGPNTWYGAVLDSVARANGWILKDGFGGEVPTSYGLLAGDISNPDYMKAWCDYVAKRAADTGCYGKFLDNVTGTMDLGSWIKTKPAKFLSDAAWADAYIKFLEFQQEYLPGIYRLANCGLGPTSDRAAWWKRVATVCDGLMVEYYDGSDAHNALISAAQDSGKDAWALIDPSAGQPSPDSSAGIALVKKFGTVWNRKGGGIGFNRAGMWRDGAGSWTAALA